MSQTAPLHINLAPGGLIPNIPENQELLTRIGATPPLSTDQLISLAVFYEAYRTTTFLADHLFLIVGVQAICTWDWLGDSTEDWLCGSEPTQEENLEKSWRVGAFQVYTGHAYKRQHRSRFVAPPTAYEIKCVPFLTPGLNLLIETINGSDPHIIGVCPDLRSQS